MRTRKLRNTRRRGGGFEYTNPTSSTLNLGLYSKQVGGTCKEKHEKYCKKSCQKLCRYVEDLPRKDFEAEMKTKISVLQTSIESLKTEHKRLVESGKARYDTYRPAYYKGGWFFDKAENKECVDSCYKTCTKGTKETCENVIVATHRLEENLKYEALLAQKKYLDSEIAGMKMNQGIYQ